MRFDMKVQEFVLLTGAGFSKDFGGFLAEEMWLEIFNNRKIQGNKNLRQLLLQYMDYEYAYEKVLSGRELELQGQKIVLDETAKTTFTEVLEDAYLKLDQILINANRFNHGIYQNIKFLSLFLQKFCGNQEKKGFFFTLNQDLLIERYFHVLPLNWNNHLQFYIPGYKDPANKFYKYNAISSTPLNKESDFITVENKIISDIDEDFFHSFKAQSFYIKLHGSLNWLRPDGKGLLITGQNKYNQLSNIPLLNWYWNIFQKVLINAKKLLIIGYGFGDQHINKQIQEAVNNGLKFYIISPDPPEKYIKVYSQSKRFGFSQDSDFSQDVANLFTTGLAGYYKANLMEMFSPDASARGKQLAQELEMSFFHSQ